MDTCPEHQQIVADIAVIKDNLIEVKNDTAEILKSIKGNGGPGLLTQSALNKAAISRIWTWITCISGSIVVMAGFAIRGLILK